MSHGIKNNIITLNTKNETFRNFCVDINITIVFKKIIVLLIIQYHNLL